MAKKRDIIHEKLCFEEQNESVTSALIELFARHFNFDLQGLKFSLPVLFKIYSPEILSENDLILLQTHFKELVDQVNIETIKKHSTLTKK